MIHARFLSAALAVAAFSAPVAAQEPTARGGASAVDTALEGMPRAGAEGRAVRVPAQLKKPKPKPQVSQLVSAERHGFKRASVLTNFPAFYPGLGIVTVRPATIPTGPWRTFDRKGRLISSIYMLGDKDIGDQKRWENVTGLPAAVNHATFYHHNGHPGFDQSHYHLVLWHVSRKDEARVAK